MQGDPMDCRLKQVEPRQSPGERAKFDVATNEQHNDRVGKMTFPPAKASSVACR